MTEVILQMKCHCCLLMIQFMWKVSYSESVFSYTANKSARFILDSHSEDDDDDDVVITVVVPGPPAIVGE